MNDDKPQYSYSEDGKTVTLLNNSPRKPFAMMSFDTAKLLDDIKAALQLSNKIGLTRQDNGYAVNQTAVGALVDLQISIEDRVKALAGAGADTKRLDWLLPNLHPANFGMDFEGGYEWASNEEFLRKFRAALDEAMK